VAVAWRRTTVIRLLDQVDGALQCRIGGDLGGLVDSLRLLNGARRSSSRVAVEYRLAAGKVEGAHLVIGGGILHAVLGRETDDGRGSRERQPPLNVLAIDSGPAGGGSGRRARRGGGVRPSKASLMKVFSGPPQVQPVLRSRLNKGGSRRVQANGRQFQIRACRPRSRHAFLQCDGRQGNRRLRSWCRLRRCCCPVDGCLRKAGHGAQKKQNDDCSQHCHSIHVLPLAFRTGSDSP
jgi:hypothetical protein